MRRKLILAGLAVAVCLCGSRLNAHADDTNKTVDTFGILEAMPADEAQARSLAWLDRATNHDAGKYQAFAELWNQPDRSVLDKIADTFALGNADVDALLKLVRDPYQPAPTTVPAVFKDVQADPFFRANLGLAVARHLSNRRAYEESLEILMGFEARQTVDPATYLFHRAVAEHALMKKDAAGATIGRLMRQAVDAPERYQTVAVLMLLDMQTWQKDLGNVARLMDNSGRRLELQRVDGKTVKIQKEIIARLDEMIRELENQAKARGHGGVPGEPGGAACPQGDIIGGAPGNDRPVKPAENFYVVKNDPWSTGKVDFIDLRNMMDQWSKLPPTEQARARQQLDDLLSGLSPVHREAFDRYFEEINNRPANKK
jgi:hypothetical protein